MDGNDGRERWWQTEASGIWQGEDIIAFDGNYLEAIEMRERERRSAEYVSNDINVKIGGVKVW